MNSLLGAVLVYTIGSAVIGWVENYVRYVRPAARKARR